MVQISFTLQVYPSSRPNTLLTPGSARQELEATLHVVDLNLLGLSLSRNQLRSADQVASVPETCLLADLGKQSKGIGMHVNLFFLRPDRKNLLDLLRVIVVRVDDNDSVQEVEGKSMGAAVIGATNARVTSVAGHDDHRGKVILESSVDHTRNDLGLALFLPFANLGVDLISDLAANLSSVAREKSKEALRPRVDDIDLV
ncbi:hypothetical protein HG530_015697 [Fusarium avenaceum]|nr:hypothetical protein HG530_015697 [Fusarium avenaceum]